jgi:NADPH2:quinone reductase
MSIARNGIVRWREPLAVITRCVSAFAWCGASTVEAGKLSLPIYKTYPLDDIAEALALMRSNQHFGKIVISIA